MRADVSQAATAAAAIVVVLAAAGCGTGTGTKCVDGTAEGSVIIRSDNDLELMMGCMHVKGHLTVMSPTITNVNALDALTTVDGSMYIQNNNALADISGLA